MTDEVVETTYGPVRGAIEDGVRVFRGIRYAAPPVGERRWRAPQPPEPWTEPADATRFAPASVQPRNAVILMPPDVRQDEDCLFLNVWASAAVGADERRPVMVWIHGGAYMFGCSAQHMYDGRALVNTGEVVLVTIDYRVGALGFADLSRLGEPGRFDANPALHDVVAALRWVQDNIARFGGDPGAVTIFGESAGGGIVTTLLTVPAARGLFVRAIAESSPATSVYDQDRSERIARQLLEKLGADDAEALRGLPAAQVTAAGMELFSEIPVSEPGTLAFAPVVDGVLVPEHPVTVYSRGDAHPVPLLLGTNADETSLFTRVKSPLLPVSATALAEMTADLRAERPELEVPDDAEIAAAYAGLRSSARGPAISRDLAFRMPAVWIAEGHSAVAPTYLYRFDWATPMLRLLGIGASHGTELPYVWGNLVGGPKDITFRLGGLRTGRALSARMQQRWRRFATTGTPDADTGPAWPAYTAPDRRSLRIDRVDSVVSDLDAADRATWGAAPLAFP
ncbi:carboxylesterase/lipase family protein [Microbacterium sp. RD1]|uniref:carboxylesterase/lipase family protein n=1 Tax=Microbacterium sp. RD1 TaxID=3457313 RepID=UPI003FA601A9